MSVAQKGLLLLHYVASLFAARPFIPPRYPACAPVLLSFRPVSAQVVSQTVQVSDRLGPFMEGLDVPAVVLLTSQRLVATAAAAITGQSSTGSGGLRLASEPPKRAVEEARLSVGMALAHVAQRLGHAHLSRRGLFGFGSQQVGRCWAWCSLLCNAGTLQCSLSVCWGYL